MIEVLLLSILLLLLAFAGFGIKMLIDKNAEFKGGSCTASSPELEKHGIDCGCAGTCSTDRNEVTHVVRIK
jgi:hypothetical protein